MNILQHRTNNAYDTILLINADTNTVVGEWSASDEALIDYHNDRDNQDAIADWSATYPDATNPAEYGDMVSESARAGRGTTFYFNTGVKGVKGDPLFGRQVLRNGTIQIPFTCNDVPDNAEFLFACDHNDLREAEMTTVIVRQILDSGPEGLMSKYAYFRVAESAQAAMHRVDMDWAGGTI